jgi:hypothetical protein
MTHEEKLKRLGALSKRRAAKRTPQSALATLVKAGFLTPEGDLAPEYGGPERRLEKSAVAAK